MKKLTCILLIFLKKRKIKKKNTLKNKVQISTDLKIGAKNIISPGVILGRNIEIGNNIHIGRNSSLHHIQIKDNSFLDANVTASGRGNGKIIIGENSYIGLNNILDYSNDITIGNNVHIAGPSTGIWTHTSYNICLHGKSLFESDEKYRPTAPVIIEDNVYIGGNCTIYPGVKIGHHSVIAPNSAVDKDVEPYSMMGGVPARLIKKIEL